MTELLEIAERIRSVVLFYRIPTLPTSVSRENFSRESRIDRPRKDNNPILRYCGANAALSAALYRCAALSYYADRLGQSW